MGHCCKAYAVFVGLEEIGHAGTVGAGGASFAGKDSSASEGSEDAQCCSAGSLAC